MAEVTEYERQRDQRIQQNRRKMEELGLLEASHGLSRAAGAATWGGVPLAAGGEQQPRMKRKVQPAPPADLEPTRLSRRLRGETAPALEQVAAAARAEAERDGLGRARAGTTRKQLTLAEGVQLAAPFSLWSIGVTVLELGHVHRGAWAQRYWSSPGCLFHHAYPVGYRATKVHFGRTYEMRIEEGPTGPLFKVIDQQSGTLFCGNSPTKPWTEVCLAHRTGQRISGPLFFGFSDPVTQRAIASNLYSREELRAALQGEKLESSSGSSEEQAAKQFCTIDGIGEATAIVLARSTALGGSQHATLASLQAWAGATDANAQALLDYLTSSSEVLESTRRWPAWRQRLVPKIVLAVSGRWLGAGPHPGAAAAAAGQAAMGPATEAIAVGAAEAGGSGAAKHEAGDANCGSSSQRQAGGTQQQAALAAEAAAPAAVRPAQAAGGGRAEAKENRQPQTRPSAKAAAAAAGPQRSSRRERKGNSKFNNLE